MDIVQVLNSNEIEILSENDSVIKSEINNGINNENNTQNEINNESCFAKETNYTENYTEKYTENEIKNEINYDKNVTNNEDFLEIETSKSLMDFDNFEDDLSDNDDDDGINIVINDDSNFCKKRILHGIEERREASFVIERENEIHFFKGYNFDQIVLRLFDNLEYPNVIEKLTDDRETNRNLVSKFCSKSNVNPECLSQEKKLIDEIIPFLRRPFEINAVFTLFFVCFHNVEVYKSINSICAMLFDCKNPESLPKLLNVSVASTKGQSLGSKPVFQLFRESEMIFFKVNPISDLSDLINQKEIPLFDLFNDKISNLSNHLSFKFHNQDILRGYCLFEICTGDFSCVGCRISKLLAIFTEKDKIQVKPAPKSMTNQLKNLVSRTGLEPGEYEVFDGSLTFSVNKKMSSFKLDVQRDRRIFKAKRSNANGNRGKKVKRLLF